MPVLRAVAPPVQLIISEAGVVVGSNYRCSSAGALPWMGTGCPCSCLVAQALPDGCNAAESLLNLNNSTPAGLATRQRARRGC